MCPRRAPYAALAVFLGTPGVPRLPRRQGRRHRRGRASSRSTGGVGLGTLATWFIIARSCAISSLAALVAAAFAPFFTALVLGFDAYFACVLVMAALLIWRHRGTSRA